MNALFRSMKILHLLAFTSLQLFVHFAAAAAPGPAKPPNFVFILIDEMAWSDVSCHGSAFYETPNIDRLAAEGMWFTDAWNGWSTCFIRRATV